MKVLLSIVFLFASLATFSQAVINFSNRAHDFGTIKEVNGAVSYDFEFVNAGTAPILIKFIFFCQNAGVRLSNGHAPRTTFPDAQ